MKRNEEVTIILEALNRNGLIDSPKMNDARCIVKGALAEIRCRKHAEGNFKNPRDIMENIISEMQEEQQKTGKNPFALSVQISGKEVYQQMVEKPTLAERVSTLEEKIEIRKECVNAGKQINPFW